jgi:hypothetical protein
MVARRVAPEPRISSRSSRLPVVVQAMPYHVQSVPDQRLIRMSYDSPGTASNSAIS